MAGYAGGTVAGNLLDPTTLLTPHVCPRRAVVSGSSRRWLSSILVTYTSGNTL